MHGEALAFVDDIAGARAFASGKANHVSGVTVRGNRLSITLIRPAPSILARLAMPIFCAVPLNTPPSPQTAIPSAGPYYIASHVRNQQIVLKRNPNYHGPRPHRLDDIVYTIGISAPKSVTRVEHGRADYVAGRLPNEVDARLAARYGPGSARQRYFLNPILALGFLGLNTHRPLFSSTADAARRQLRDRPARAREAGQPDQRAGSVHDDRNRPLPAVDDAPGFERTSIYPLGGRHSHRPPPGGRTPPHRRHLQLRHRARLLLPAAGAADQALAGVDRDTRASADVSVPVMVARTFRKGEPWDIALLDWGADFADPSSFLDLLAPSVSERWQTKIDEANRLSPPARYPAFGKLAVELARDAAPWVSYANGTARDFFSARMGCQVFQPVYGMDLGALCTRR